MTIITNVDYTVAAGEVLDFTDPNGFLLIEDTTHTNPSLTNFGTISVSDSGNDQDCQGITFSNGFFADSVIHNEASGVIEIITTNEFSDATAIGTGSWGGSVINDGLIIVQSPDWAVGVDIEDYLDGDNFFENNGRMEITGNQAWGARLEDSFTNTGALTVTAGTSAAVGLYLNFRHVAVFENSGSIVVSSASGTSLGVQFLGGGMAKVLHNSGLIQATVAVVDGSTGATEFDNSGTIVGAVQLNDGNDDLINTGRIKGSIDLGSGDDIYSGARGKLIGGADGGLGNDVMTGGKLADTLNGDGGRDLLNGGKGDDTLSGDGGQDTLFGGLGADTLKGGGGKDTFIYQSIADSAHGASDLIVHLSATDVINLSQIDADVTVSGNQAFALVSALDGHAGEAALTYDAGAKLTTLALDVDGDGVADSIVTMTGDQSGFAGFVL